MSMSEMGGCSLSNESGISLIEALLTLMILMLITGSLVPLHSRLNSSLYAAKTELHASEVAYQGALQVKRGEASAGTLFLENVEYNWRLRNSSICVSFKVAGKEHLKCIGN